MQESHPPAQQMYTAPKPYFTSFPRILQEGNWTGACVASAVQGTEPCAAFVVSTGMPLGGELGFPLPMGCTVEIGNKKVKEK